MNSDRDEIDEIDDFGPNENIKQKQENSELNVKEYPKTLEEAIERIKNMEDRFYGLSMSNIELEKRHLMIEESMRGEINSIEIFKRHNEESEKQYIHIIELLLDGKYREAVKEIRCMDDLWGDLFLE